MQFGWTSSAATRHSRRMIGLLALLAAWFAGAPAWAGALTAIEIGGDHVTLRFDDRAEAATAFVLDGPRRIAIDVAGIAPGAAMRPGGAVTAVRQSARDGGTRVVLDLARPALVTDGRIGADGRTLTLAIRPVDADTFARKVTQRLSFLPATTVPNNVARASVAMRLPAAKPALPLPRVEGDRARPLVVIDAGHGGHDPGAISPDGTLREKDLTLKVARAMRDALLASGRVRVAMTRDDDRFLVLQERYGIARRLGAKLFISVHCDSAGNPEASGATVYTLSEIASDKEAARLAARENKADIIAGVDLGDATPDISSILIDLTQRETMNTSAQFARLLGREALPLIPTKPAFHRFASLVVLKAPDMPSILFETGYISNQRDADFLNSSEGRARVADTVRRAVEIHFATRMAAR